MDYLGQNTPIPDYDDEEALTGHSSMGEFVGFKLHVSCNEFCVPLRAEFSVRICVEQCNSVLKLEVMREYWTRIKGYAKKAVFALTAVLALQAVAISNLIEWGYPSIRISDVRA